MVFTILYLFIHYNPVWFSLKLFRPEKICLLILSGTCLFVFRSRRTVVGTLKILNTIDADTGNTLDSWSNHRLRKTGEVLNTFKQFWTDVMFMPLFFTEELFKSLVASGIFHFEKQWTLTKCSLLVTQLLIPGKRSY